MCIRDRPTTFCIKKATFGSPKRKDKPCLGHFVRSYRSFARPIRILCTSVAHQKSCSRLGPVHSLHTRADQRKRLYAMHMQFSKLRVPCIFFVSFVLHTPFFPIFDYFFENVLPALGGKHNFERCINKKSWERSLSDPHLSGKVPLRTYCTWKFAKSIGKVCISCLWCLLGVNFMCHLLFHLRLYCSERPPFQNFIDFFENVLAALGGEHNLKAASMKNHEKRPFRTPVWREKFHFGATYCTWKFAKSIVKMCISCLWRLLGVSFASHLLLHLCILHTS